ncbi:MAG: UDP-N-acetylmuramate:L-alanyl-gamma-D-glutamyl-meso-diaminopimelate ligase [Pseudomonadota bacterium]
MKHLHIMGIGGTFMAGIALIARDAGFQVTGSDGPLYPPMSTQLEQAGITVLPEPDWSADHFLVGNTLSRGHAWVEQLLRSGKPFSSAPAWLQAEIFPDRWVCAVSGTHGKTTTSSMLAHILTECGLNPGYLIGGVPNNFNYSATLGTGKPFVIEADEYDTAYFDKRPKFLHWFPKTLIINNIEYDHADIYPSLESIQRQFQYLIRAVPPEGCVITQTPDPNVEAVLAKGMWSQHIRIGLEEGPWQARLHTPCGQHFELIHQGKRLRDISWAMMGTHQIGNALRALCAAEHVGADIETAVAALETFKSVKRRLEYRGTAGDLAIWEDFAHHPTAIRETLNTLVNKLGEKPWVICELGTRSMQLGIYKDTLLPSCAQAAGVIWYVSQPLQWSLEDMLGGAKNHIIAHKLSEVIVQVQKQPMNQLLILSNKNADAIIQALQSQKITA